LAASDEGRKNHRQFKHPKLSGVITLSGSEGDDSKIYQERQVAEVIAKSREKE